MGKPQDKIVERESKIDCEGIHDAWKRLPRAEPWVVFVVCVKGDLYADLMKPVHAEDTWNSIAVLIASENRKEEAPK